MKLKILTLFMIIGMTQGRVGEQVSGEERQLLNERDGQTRRSMAKQKFKVPVYKAPTFKIDVPKVKIPTYNNPTMPPTPKPTPKPTMPPTNTLQDGKGECNVDADCGAGEYCRRVTYLGNFVSGVEHYCANRQNILDGFKEITKDGGLREKLKDVFDTEIPANPQLPRDQALIDFVFEMTDDYDFFTQSVPRSELFSNFKNNEKKCFHEFMAIWHRMEGESEKDIPQIDDVNDWGFIYTYGGQAIYEYMHFNDIIHKVAGDHSFMMTRAIYKDDDQCTEAAMQYIATLDAGQEYTEKIMQIFGFGNPSVDQNIRFGPRWLKEYATSTDYATSGRYNYRYLVDLVSHTALDSFAPSHSQMLASYGFSYDDLTLVGDFIINILQPDSSSGPLYGLGSAFTDWAYLDYANLQTQPYFRTYAKDLINSVGFRTCVKMARLIRTTNGVTLQVIQHLHQTTSLRDIEFLKMYMNSQIFDSINVASILATSKYYLDIVSHVSQNEIPIYHMEWIISALDHNIVDKGMSLIHGRGMYHYHTVADAKEKFEDEVNLMVTEIIAGLAVDLASMGSTVVSKLASKAGGLGLGKFASLSRGMQSIRVPKLLTSNRLTKSIADTDAYKYLSSLSRAAKVSSSWAFASDKLADAMKLLNEGMENVAGNIKYLKALKKHWDTMRYLKTRKVLQKFGLDNGFDEAMRLGTVDDAFKTSEGAAHNIRTFVKNGKLTMPGQRTSELKKVEDFVKHMNGEMNNIAMDTAMSGTLRSAMYKDMARMFMKDLSKLLDETQTGFLIEMKIGGKTIYKDTRLDIINVLKHGGTTVNEEIFKALSGVNRNMKLYPYSVNSVRRNAARPSVLKRAVTSLNQRTKAHHNKMFTEISSKVMAHLGPIYRISSKATTIGLKNGRKGLKNPKKIPKRLESHGVSSSVLEANDVFADMSHNSQDEIYTAIYAKHANYIDNNGQLNTRELSEDDFEKIVEQTLQNFETFRGHDAFACKSYRTGISGAHQKEFRITPMQLIAELHALFTNSNWQITDIIDFQAGEFSFLPYTEVSPMLSGGKTGSHDNCVWTENCYYTDNGANENCPSGMKIFDYDATCQGGFTDICPKKGACGFAESHYTCCTKENKCKQPVNDKINMAETHENGMFTYLFDDNSLRMADRVRTFLRETDDNKYKYHRKTFLPENHRVSEFAATVVYHQNENEKNTDRGVCSSNYDCVINGFTGDIPRCSGRGCGALFLKKSKALFLRPTMKLGFQTATDEYEYDHEEGAKRIGRAVGEGAIAAGLITFGGPTGLVVVLTYYGVQGLITAFDKPEAPPQYDETCVVNAHASMYDFILEKHVQNKPLYLPGIKHNKFFNVHGEDLPQHLFEDMPYSMDDKENVTESILNDVELEIPDTPCLSSQFLANANIPDEHERTVFMNTRELLANFAGVASDMSRQKYYDLCFELQNLGTQNCVGTCEYVEHKNRCYAKGLLVDESIVKKAYITEEKCVEANICPYCPYKRQCIWDENEGCKCTERVI